MSTTSTVSLVADYPTLEITSISDQVVVELTPDDPTLEVTALTGTVASVTLENEPEPTDCVVTAVVGGVSTVDLEAPLPNLLLETGATVELVGESSLEVTAITGGVASVSLVAPLPTLGIDGFGDQVASVSLQPGLPVLAVTAVSGSVATVELEAALPTLLVEAFGLGESSVSLEAPLPKLDVTALAGSSSTITLIAPLPELLIEAEAVLAEVFEAWCMNVENAKVANYTEFPFTALVCHGGQYFGVASDGIYLLEGADDAGAEINTEIKFGFDDFGSDQNKRVPFVYVGCKAEGDLMFSVSVDDEPEYALAFSPRKEGIHNTRVKPGRGHKGRYWQPGLRNVKGVDFEIASMSLIEQVLQGRVN